MYTYHLNKLAEKFAEIRRKDLINTQRKLAKSRECNAYIENQKMILEQKTQEEVNELFTAAMGSTRAPKKTSMKPDYSKYRIVKRSKSSTSSTPTSSSSSSSSSPTSQ
ncbi:Protein CBG10079 [Caenorhabditis briggsae]|nr:Protein CBG10079 [Caenorhabditis briggsae]CAP29589.2 Protein CBG10079 [Caenorhabditis briggsae]